MAFEQSMQQQQNTTVEPLASSMLVIMVRGLFTKLQFPYAQFPCASVSGDLLFDPFWEAVSRIERLGLKVNDFLLWLLSSLSSLLLFTVSCVRSWHQHFMEPLSTGVF